jgi:hypothetical protein
MYSNLSGPAKAVCYREVFTIGVDCYKRFHCICDLPVYVHVVCVLETSSTHVSHQVMHVTVPQMSFCSQFTQRNNFDRT